MCVKFPLKNLNSDLCSPHLTSIYICGVTTAPKMCGGVIKTLWNVWKTLRVFFFFFETKSDFIYEKSRCKMGKGKKGYCSNHTMTYSSFAALTKAKAARLHRKGILRKEIKVKLSLKRLTSSSIQATSREKILSEISRYINLAKLHSTYNFKK